LPLGPRTVVVAGDGSGPAARSLAERAGWPLLAEPTSGSRTGAAAIRTYRLLLRSAKLAGQIERVVVFGRPTLSRPVTELLSRPDVDVVVVSPRPWWPDPGLTAGLVTTAVRVSATDDIRWTEAWRAADRELSRRLDALVAAEPGLTPYEVAAVVSATMPPRGLLVVGSSNPIRDLDLMATAPPVGNRHKVIANRGLSGIDGTVSTAVGASLGRDSSRSVALMGDLTFVHDANGLVLGPDEPRPDLTIVVVNDDGGGIFATLEQGAPEHSASFERVSATPHHLDLAALCAASATPHERVEDAAGLRAALARNPSGIQVIEVPADRRRRRELDLRIRALTDTPAG
jgi:2-succinyl-5-enolpyruvyl-6-hydroxy-3-cyclohexene-1-carboxylate synthase